MKALTVRQPWAARIARGDKTIEVRGRRTSHRGPLLIVAGLRDSEGRRLPQSGGLVSEVGSQDLPAGVSVCTVNLVACRPFVPEDEPAAGVPWRPGLWAWVLEDARPVLHVKIRGVPALFEAGEWASGTEETATRCAMVSPFLPLGPLTGKPEV